MPRAPASSSGPTAPSSLMPPPPPPPRAARRRHPFPAPSAPLRARRRRSPGPAPPSRRLPRAGRAPARAAGARGAGRMHGRRRGRRKEAAAEPGPAPAAAWPAPGPRRRRDSLPGARPRSPGWRGGPAGGSSGSRDCGGAAPRAPSNEGAAAAARVPDPARPRLGPLGLPGPQAGGTSPSPVPRKREAQKGLVMSREPYTARGVLGSQLGAPFSQHSRFSLLRLSLLRQTDECPNWEAVSLKAGCPLFFPNETQWLSRLLF